MKMRMKNNLDEMQEQELLKIEHNGCWLAFWLLLAAMVVQALIYGQMNARTLAGEWIVFMILALYLAIACVQKGIWDRHLKMNNRTNLIASLLAGVFTGVFNAAVIFRSFHSAAGTIMASAITAVITFLACFALLTVMMKQTMRKKA